MIDMGILSSGLKTVNTGVNNVAMGYINIGKSFWYPKANTFSNCKNTYGFAYQDWVVRTEFYGNSVGVAIGKTEATNYKAMVCIEYTKTTD